MSIIIIWVIAGIIVALIANSKGRNGCAWFIYGFLLWPIALVHILVARPNEQVVHQRTLSSGLMKKCPHCAELVQPDARVCRYCDRDLD